ncbi:hypothetical protein V8E36_000565 [Tilletia maclaganii]
MGLATALAPPDLGKLAQSGRILDVCATGDPICSGPATLMPQAHLEYLLPQSQHTNAQFVIQHLRAG